MKILHWAIILVILVLPFSLVCRINVNAKFSALKDEVRINNAIDTATKDAIDQLISTNQAMDFDGEFGGVLNITPSLAQAAVDTFFHTMAVNYNIPYQVSDFNSSDDGYIKNYFSSYIPAMIIVAYDGFYIYSLENLGSGYTYQMSSKIPYVCDYGAYSVGYTLGEDIYLYYNGKSYSGKVSGDSLDEIIDYQYKPYKASYDLYMNPSTMSLVDYIAATSNDMSAIIYALSIENSINFDNHILPSSGVTNFLAEYEYSGDGQITKEAGAFHSKRQEVIIDIITSCLNEEINDHKTFASITGITYDFQIPTLSQQDWVNTIDDISFLAFVQGIPIGNAEGTYYNNFALGGSKIVRSGYIYVTEGAEDNIYYYHNLSCKNIPKDRNGDLDYLRLDEFGIKSMVKSKAAAIAAMGEDNKVYPCLLCN